MERYIIKNERFKALKLLIPVPSKGGRASIVQDGIDYINDLCRLVSELKYLVEKKKCGERHKNIKVDNGNSLYAIRDIEHPFSTIRLDDDDDDDDDGDEYMEKKPERDVIDQCSWVQKKSKVIEVYVRIIDNEVTIKVVQKKKISCLFFVSKVLDQFLLDLHHVAGGNFGEHYSFLLKTKIYEGSTIDASAIANRMIEVVEKHYKAALPINNY